MRCSSLLFAPNIMANELAIRNEIHCSSNSYVGSGLVSREHRIFIRMRGNCQCNSLTSFQLT